MANAIVTIRIMPESIEADLNAIAHHAETKIDTFVGKKLEKQVKHVPIAFGLKAVDIIFMIDEDRGSPDELADDMSTIDGVQNAEITGVSRA